VIFRSAHLGVKIADACGNPQNIGFGHVDDKPNSCSNAVLFCVPFEIRQLAPLIS